MDRSSAQSNAANSPAKASGGKHKSKPVTNKNRYADFDPSCPNLLHPLADDELAAIAIYLQYFDEHGRYPEPENKMAVLFQGGKRIGCPVELKKDHVESVMFADLFPYNREIHFSVAIKRFLGERGTRVSVEECYEAIRWLSDELTRESGGDQRIIPTPSDVDTAARQGRIVPALGCPMPKYTTIQTSCGPGSWVDVIARSGLRADYEFSKPKERWNRSKIYAAYMVIWEKNGLDKDPPNITKLQTIHSADEVARSCVNGRSMLNAPTPPTIQKYFGGEALFLGHVEKISGRDIVVTDSRRKGLLVGNTIRQGLDLDLVPKSIAQAVRARTAGMSLD